MQRIQHNDLEAFEVLYQRHQIRVWNYFKKRVPHRAEDLFQDCFARLLERRDQWNGSPFLPWLLLMARHLLIDDYRKEKRRSHLSEMESESLGSVEIEEWLEGLSTENAKLIREHYLSGLSYQELAQKYATQESSLRQKVSRALKSIRKEWK